jgi:hypothetical protein
MKLAVAWISIADGATGMMSAWARASISCSMRPVTPAGASMMSCCVDAGTCMLMVRKPVFCGAAFAPWMRGAWGGRTRSQLSVEPCGS